MMLFVDLRVTIPTPMKRGLKVWSQSGYSFDYPVTIPTPMKRGLKVWSQSGYSFDYPVTIPTPMKRGLKAPPASHPRTARTPLQSLPR